MHCNVCGTMPAHLPPSAAHGAAEHVCVHVRAAAEVVGYTHKLRLETAAHLVEAGLIQVDEGTGICTTSTLADITKAVHCRPHEGACTCHGQAQHGICCHLLAAAKLPFFVGAELPMVVQLATPEDASEVSAWRAGGKGGISRRVRSRSQAPNPMCCHAAHYD